MKRRLVVACVIALVCIGCGGKGEGKVPGNHLPVVNEATILPQNPAPRSELIVQIISSDPDGDPLTWEVRWFVNGREIGEGMQFVYEDAVQGDTIHAEVRPFDGKEWGSCYRVPAVVLSGGAPRVVALEITPQELFVTTPEVAVTALLEDPDNDSLQVICHWLVGDSVIPNTSNVLVLRNYDLKKGDVIVGSAFATDGQFRSEPFPFELHIANSPPVFKTRIDSVKTRPDSLNYPVPIIDPDGDALTFRLLDGPDGVAIDPHTGVIWGNAGDVSSLEVLVRATDTEGAYLDARFNLTAP